MIRIHHVVHYCILLAHSSFQANVSTVSAPPVIPVQPKNGFPSPDETLMITGAYLNDPLVTSALAYIATIVPEKTLQIRPSTYVQDSTVNYTADPIANCYWPNNQCVRNAVGDWGQADIISCPNDYQWGLTYDDAPTTNIVNGQHYNDTFTLIALLNQLNIKATFFVTGSQSIFFPDALMALKNDTGMHIAHHSWSHHPMTALTNAQIVAEMLYTQASIYNVTGLSTKYFRPPYGDIDDRVRAIINALGFRIVIWGTNYDSTDADVVVNAADYTLVLKIIKSWFNTKPGFVSLQHTIDTFTNGVGMAALKEIIAMGGIMNQMMTVPQCLNDTQWYRNLQVTTLFNSCTIPTGCKGNTTSSTMGSSRSNATASTSTATLRPQKPATIAPQKVMVSATATPSKSSIPAGASSSNAGHLQGAFSSVIIGIFMAITTIMFA